MGQELLLDFGWCYRSQKQPPHCPMAVCSWPAGSVSQPRLRQAVCCCELSGGPEVSAAACSVNVCAGGLGGTSLQAKEESCFPAASC